MPLSTGDFRSERIRARWPCSGAKPRGCSDFTEFWRCACPIRKSKGTDSSGVSRRSILSSNPGRSERTGRWIAVASKILPQVPQSWLSSWAPPPASPRRPRRLDPRLLPFSGLCPGPLLGKPRHLPPLFEPRRGSFGPQDLNAQPFEPLRRPAPPPFEPHETRRSVLPQIRALSRRIRRGRVFVGVPETTPGHGPLGSPRLARTLPGSTTTWPPRWPPWRGRTTPSPSPMRNLARRSS